MSDDECEPLLQNNKLLVQLRIEEEKTKQKQEEQHTKRLSIIKEILQSDKIKSQEDLMKLIEKLNERPRHVAVTGEFNNTCFTCNIIIHVGRIIDFHFTFFFFAETAQAHRSSSKYSQNWPQCLRFALSYSSEIMAQFKSLLLPRSRLCAAASTSCIEMQKKD